MNKSYQSPIYSKSMHNIKINHSEVQIIGAWDTIDNRGRMQGTSIPEILKALGRDEKENNVHRQDTETETNSITKKTRCCSSFVLTIITLVSICILLERGRICVSKFLTKDTVIRERVMSFTEASEDTDSPFIELTICPSYESAYREEVLNAYGMDKEKYRGKGVYSPSNNSKGMELRSIFNNVTYDIDELLFRISIRTNSQQNRSFDFEFDGKDFMEHIDVITKYYHHFGRCFSLHPKKHILSLGVNAIVVVARINVYVYFGHPGQFMSLNTKSKAGTSLGEMVYLDFVNNLFINTLEGLAGHTCNSEVNYNYDKKFYDKIAKENNESFNCSVPFHPSIKSKLTGNPIEICNSSETGKKALENWVVSFYSGPLTTINKPCAEMEIFLGLPFIYNNGLVSEAYIKIYIKPDIKVKSVILYYDLTTLFAELGGYIGMFLGISLVDLTIICNSAFSKAIAANVRNKY